MQTARYVFWQDAGHWLGYFEDFPDYQTQGESLEDLQEHLRDLYRDLTSVATAKFCALRRTLPYGRGSDQSRAR